MDANERAIAQTTAGYAERGMAASGGAHHTAWRVGSETLRSELRKELEELAPAGLTRRDADELRSVWQRLIAERFKDLRDHLAPRTGLRDDWRILSVEAEQAAVDDLTQLLASRAADRRAERRARRGQVVVRVVGGIVVIVIAALITHVLWP